MRDEVKSFAQAMEQRLLLHDSSKGENGWKSDYTPDFFLKRLREQQRALEDAAEAFARAQRRRVPYSNVESLRTKILELAADIGNYTMFVADHHRALPEYDDGKDDPAFTDRDADE